MKDVDGARFISLSSSAHALTGILWDDIHFHHQPYDKWMAYGQSKTASSLIAIEFNEKMKNYGVSGFAVHPGGIITPFKDIYQRRNGRFGLDARRWFSH